MLENKYKLYDKNGIELKAGDILKEEELMIHIHNNEWYLAGINHSWMWSVTEFVLDKYKEGYKLVDFEKE